MFKYNCKIIKSNKINFWGLFDLLVNIGSGGDDSWIHIYWSNILTSNHLDSGHYLRKKYTSILE